MIGFLILGKPFKIPVAATIHNAATAVCVDYVACVVTGGGVGGADVSPETILLVLLCY